MNKFLTPKNSGLTLVEVLVSMALFSILSISFVTLFTTSMNSQASILQNQELLNQSGYVVDYMHRFLRMAARDDVGDCVGASKINTAYGGNGSSNEIYFLGYDTVALGYRCMRFYLDTDHKIKITKYTTAGRTGSPTPMELTSSTVTVNDLKFNVTGDTVGDNIQPKIAIMINMKSSSLRVNPVPSILIQTTASQRNLDAP